MHTSHIVLAILRCGNAFGLLPEPYSRNMPSRQRVRGFIRHQLWGLPRDAF